MQVRIVKRVTSMSYEIATLIALVLGPVTAVLITLWHQDRAAKRGAKERLFISLMAHRKSIPPNYEWVNSLNLIDVVYADHPKVVSLWHELYDILVQIPLNEQRRVHKFLELVSAIASVLGYKNLTQTDIDKFYSPEAHGLILGTQWGVQTELLRVLKNTHSLSGAQPISEAPAVIEAQKK